jgi:hypothetical protein
MVQLSRKQRLRAEDLEECGRVGEEYGLGAIEAVTRDLDDPTGMRGLGWTAVILAFVGVSLALPIDAALAPSSSGVEIIAGICGVLAVAGVPLILIGGRFANVAGRQCLYSGGVARFGRDEPEPKVLRWNDVDTVTIETNKDEGKPQTSVAGCVLRGRAGIELKARHSDGERMALAARRGLAPRLAAAMIYAYDRGEPVIAGSALVSQQGVTFPDGKNLAWARIGGVELEHPSRAARSLTTRIDFRQAGWKWSSQVLDPSGIPNGIFLADVIAHAARQHGVLVAGDDPQL